MNEERDEVVRGLIAEIDFEGRLATVFGSRHGPLPRKALLP